MFTVLRSQNWHLLYNICLSFVLLLKKYQWYEFRGVQYLKTDIVVPNQWRQDFEEDYKIQVAYFFSVEGQLDLSRHVRIDRAGRKPVFDQNNSPAGRKLAWSSSATRLARLMVQMQHDAMAWTSIVKAPTRCPWPWVTLLLCRPFPRLPEIHFTVVPNQITSNVNLQSETAQL